MNWPTLKISRAHGVVIAVWLLRLLLGALFMVSGMSKAIDPYGFVFKIEEYLAVWGFAVPRSLTILAAISLSGFEFVLGLMLSTGCYRRTSVWLLLAQMAVMLPLTAYIWIASPVSDCGCFGDFLKISNGATFLKNVLITAALIYLCVFNGRVVGLYHKYAQWAVAVVGGVFSLVVSLYGINVQPLVDFRSFPVGTQLAGDDSADVYNAPKFVYERDGRSETFDIDNLPDSTWTFVERLEPEIIDDKTEFAVYDEAHDNITSDVIYPDGPQLLLIIPSLARADVSATYIINELQRTGRFEEGRIAEIVAGDSLDVADWEDKSMLDMPLYVSEETVLKELARGDMSAVYLENGRILWKRSLNSVDLDLIASSPKGLNVYSDFRNDTFLIMSLISLTLLFLIYLLDSSRRIFANVRYKIKKRTFR